MRKKKQERSGKVEVAGLKKPLTMTLTDEEREQIEALADKYDWSRSQVMGALLRFYLEAEACVSSVVRTPLGDYMESEDEDWYEADPQELAGRMFDCLSRGLRAPSKEEE